MEKTSVLPIIPISPDEPCPFNHLNLNFTTKSLRSIDKDWLGAQLFYKKMSSYELQKKYGIPASTLRRYKNRLINGKLNQEKHGRPTLLDEISQTNLQQITENFNETTATELSSLLLQEVRETSSRRGCKCVNSITPSDRSKRKYLKILKHKKIINEQANLIRSEACKSIEKELISTPSILSTHLQSEVEGKSQPVDSTEIKNNSNI